MVLSEEHTYFGMVGKNEMKIYVVQKIVLLMPQIYLIFFESERQLQDQLKFTHWLQQSKNVIKYCPCRPCS